MTAWQQQIGFDIGSTTIKLVVWQGSEIVYGRYTRHYADIAGEISRMLRDLQVAMPDLTATVRVTGSAGLGVAQWLDLPFVQEVVAETEAVSRLYPAADVIIELGGEDAKITYLHPVPEQRMNGTCAGGTGAFIDQMAVLLQTDAAGLNRLAAEAGSIYPIASRCGVFAKSDLQPLLNDGASRQDLAASVLQAVVNQTIAGLACGRPIRGTVILLGGPLHFLPELRQAFIKTLADRADGFITPDHAQLLVAVGAAMLADGETVSIDALCERLASGRRPGQELTRIAPLFASEGEKTRFFQRHQAVQVAQASLAETSGPCFLGIDAGSTTTKAVLIDRKQNIRFTWYSGNQGKPVGVVRKMLEALRAGLPASAWIAYACVTGYGENLIRSAFQVDEGEVETLAHYKAAASFMPVVDFIIDIGGQDMKCLTIKDGAIDNIRINEACSSGCGSFLQSFAETLNLPVASFAELALGAANPVDLGTRCTVFMNSRVKQALKEGASVGDLSAGLSYSVVRNALYKVIKFKTPEQLGRHIVVQGGTFLNDAVLRCFELVTGREVVRPPLAGLMGAFGAALLARERCANPDTPSRLLSAEELAGFTLQTKRSVCHRCANQCRLTVALFPGGRSCITGNRCERGAGKDRHESLDVPDLFAEKYQRLFAYEPLSPQKAGRGEIGLPRVLNLYENYPFWFTVLTRLGYRVVLSVPSDHQLFTRGMATIPSESVCYPAKLAHGHIEDLVSRGIKTIFYPDIVFEEKESPGAANHYNCPIVISYPEVIKTNVLPLLDRSVRLINPFFALDRPRKMASQLAEALKHDQVNVREAAQAIAAGFAEMARVKEQIRQRGKAVMQALARTGRQGIVLAGRPYHLDPEIHHGIPQLITSLGMAVLTEDSVAEPGRVQRPLRVLDQWAYHTRLYEAAAVVAEHPELELVQLNSFGCGLDAVTTDQVQEILAAKNRRYTVLKIDEVNNLGAARIRLRSLQVAMQGDQREQVVAAQGKPTTSCPWPRVPFSRQMKREHTILAPQMAPLHFSLIEAVLRHGGYRVSILQKATAEDIEAGLKYVNNDACYPSIIVAGQIVNALQRGDFDPQRCSVFLTQTGGGCRASNYVAFLRKALFDAGYPQVPVVSINMSGLESNPGFQMTLPLLHRVVQALVLGDLFQTLLLRIRPYEKDPGCADKRYRYWNSRSREWLRAGRGRTSFTDLVDQIVTDFDCLPIDAVQRRPRVGIVGEILVKFHPDANNHLIDLIEAEGCEAVMPGLIDFFLYCFANSGWRQKNLGTSRKAAWVGRLAIRLIEAYRTVMVRRLQVCRGKFMLPEKIDKLADRAERLLSLGNDCGEGWFLTAEMMELLEQDVANIVCVQPFACLPNHVTGKGMLNGLRRLYPQANIVAIDYDPGASAVNQLNRIKLMLAATRRGQAAGQATLEKPINPEPPPANLRDRKIPVRKDRLSTSK